MKAKNNGGAIGTGVAALSARLRIWQVDASMHCSVLGTCLTLNDLHVIARRAGHRLDPSTSAYDLHSWFVDHMAYPNDLSRLVDKTLEKRHAVAVQQIRRARTEAELEARWKEVAARGAIAGAYWAAMSHPVCSKGLHWKLFGEIHMLSHLVGASRSSEICRVHELEVMCAALDGQLAQTKHEHRAVLKDRKSLEDELAARRLEHDRSERRLRLAQERIGALESETSTRRLEARQTELEQELAAAHARAAAAESLLTETRSLLEDARRSHVLAAEQVLELSAENVALESELSTSIFVDQEPEHDDVGLGGKRILYVGGRSHLVPHYRALVERRGGAFLHHDGGIEESVETVTRALTTVDAVLCPVDCVSHGACVKVKQACKRMAKQFIPLRSSGLSSFARGIHALACAT